MWYENYFSGPAYEIWAAKRIDLMEDWPVEKWIEWGYKGGKVELNQTRLLKHLDQLKSNFVPSIKDAGQQASIQLANRIPYLFPEYTLHDIGHSIRVMEYMADIIGDLSKLSELEISILIMSALLHDIGMAIGGEEIQNIKVGKRDTENMVFSAMVEKYEDESHALQEFVRHTHAELSSRIAIAKYGRFMDIADMPGISYAEDVSKVCLSHTRDASFVNTLPDDREKGCFKYNLKYCSHILRIADLLDIDSRRTPLTLYELVSPKGIGDTEWLQHYSISNADKIKIDVHGRKQITFYGECHNPKTHRKLLRYFDWINEELQIAVLSTSKMPHNYWLNIDDSVQVSIEPKGYTFSDFKLSVDFRAITELLKGENIYGEKRLGLRELIQNSIDACKIRQELEARSAEMGRDVYQPTIRIILDALKNKVIVRDNGIGMTGEEIKKYFLNIGRSYYVSDDYAFRGHKYRPIGAYGIGFLSCFMLSDSVIVRTRSANSKYRYELGLEKGSEYICFTQAEGFNEVGTDVELDYGQFITAMEMKEKENELESFISKYFIFDDIRCEIISQANPPISASSGDLVSRIQLPKDHDMLHLSKFLNDINAYALVKKRMHFIRKTSDITHGVGYFLYIEGGKLVEVNENELDFKQLCKDDKIVYLDIPVIRSNDEDDFDTAVKYLKDVDQALEEFDELERLFIFAPGPQQCDLESGDTEKYEDFELVDGITIGDALEITGLKGKGFCPMVNQKEINVIASDDGRLLLPYKMSEKRFPFYKSFFPDQKRETLYIRNVLIKDYANDLMMPIVSVIELVHIYANIRNPGVLPDISRNKLAPKATANVAYALNKAVHLAAYEQIEYHPSEKDLLKKFIEKHYSSQNFLNN